MTVRKGKARMGGQAKLSWEQVLAIREASKRRKALLQELKSLTLKALAKEYNVHTSTIWAAESYQYYRYVKERE